ncbi:MAG: hypothetical protein JO157_07600 [Acetobacteraceae bacterium]|nr:hypothetical protein [Acetobacteraceae bacterium]
MAEPSAYRMTGDIMLPDDRRTLLRNRVSWGAIFAGIASALAIDLLLYILGVGVGASSLSVLNTAQNPSAGGFSIDASIWLVVSGIIASFVGGIVAGRLCGAGSRSTAAWHGFVTWAATTLAVAYLLATAAGGLLGGTFSALGATLSGFGKAAASSVSGAVSGAATGAAQNGAGGDALQAQVRRLVNPNDAQSVESDITSYIRASANGNQQAASAAQDRAVNDLARVANVSQDEAKTRIQQAAQQYQQTLDQAKQEAAKAAQAARSGVAQAGIYGFVALVIGAIAGWIGGAAGAPRRERVLARDDRFIGRDDMPPMT